MEDARKDKDLAIRHPSLHYPYLETQAGEIIFETSAIASHLARMNPAANLAGSKAFEEAQINQWVAWADSNKMFFQYVTEAVQGVRKTDDLKYGQMI